MPEPCPTCGGPCTKDVQTPTEMAMLVSPHYHSLVKGEVLAEMWGRRSLHGPAAWEVFDWPAPRSRPVRIVALDAEKVPLSANALAELERLSPKPFDEDHEETCKRCGKPLRREVVSIAHSLDGGIDGNIRTDYEVCANCKEEV